MVKSKNEIQLEVGQDIRCYDFPGLDRKHCYVEGTILRVCPKEYPDCIEFVCSVDSLANKDHSRVGTVMYTPIETGLDDIWEHERIVILDK